jgi:O-acetyl-ADP-ribose deacetylase (regulator of RNase III)
LPADYIVHAVAPRRIGDDKGEPEFLRSAYRAIFALTADHKIESVAIPAIGTGIYGLPFKQETRIAVEEAKVALKTQNIRVVGCCLDMEPYAGYTRAIDEIGYM